MSSQSKNASEGESSNHFRTRRRAANHLSAHQPASDSASQGSTFNHPLVPQGIEPIVDDQGQLQSLIDRLRLAGRFAYDSEFIGESSYHPQLCLVQIATEQFVALIDPMADIDLRPFWELLADPSVEKLVHAGEQDLEPVVRHLQRPALNIFDTQVCAGFAAMAFPSSLAKLVLEFTGIRLGKGLTFTDWSQRPLSDVQMRYAADDVRYLPMIAAEMKKKLVPLGHLQWAVAESTAMGEPSRFLFDFDADYLRVRGAGSLPPENLAVLRELTAWRDQAAQTADMPPRAYLRDEVLLALARSPIKSANQFAKVRNLPRPVEANEGEAIIAATLRGLAAGSGQLPVRAVEPSPSQRFAADALWAAVQAMAAGRSIDPALISSRQEIGDLYRHLASGTDPSELRVMKGWRREAIGDAIMKLFSGVERYSLHWNEGLEVERLNESMI